MLIRSGHVQNRTPLRLQRLPRHALDTSDGNQRNDVDAPAVNSPDHIPVTSFEPAPTNVDGVLTSEPNSYSEPMASVVEDQIRESLRQEYEVDYAQKLDALREESERRRHAAEQEAHRRGLSEGRESAEADFHKTQDRINQLIGSIENALEQKIAGAEDAMVEIAFEAVMKILGGALVDKEGVIAVVREVMRHAKDRENLVLRVSPDDYGLLHANHDQLKNGTADQSVEILADDRVALGGCLLETSGGSLDGRLEVQVQQFRDALLSAKSRQPESPA